MGIGAGMAIGKGADFLTLSIDFRDWFYGLAGTVSSGVGAQMSNRDRVSPAIRFPGTYTARPTEPRGHTRPQHTFYPLFH